MAGPTFLPGLAGWLQSSHCPQFTIATCIILSSFPHYLHDIISKLTLPSSISFTKIHFPYSLMSLNPCLSLLKLARSNIVKYVEIFPGISLSFDCLANISKALFSILQVDKHTQHCLFSYILRGQGAFLLYDGATFWSPGPIPFSLFRDIPESQICIFNHSLLPYCFLSAY